MKQVKPGDYHSFFKNYMDLAPSGAIKTLLQENLEMMCAFFNKIPVEKHNFKYAEKKWTVKEVLAHLIDSERVFSYRALVCLRMDAEITLPEMNEDRYAANFTISDRSFASLVEEFELVRKSMLKLYESANDKNYDFKANATSGAITARSLAYITIGHALHHKNVLQERYFT